MERPNIHPIWETLSAARTERFMTGRDPLAGPNGKRDYVKELAKLDVVNVGAMAPVERLKYSLRLASSF